MKAKTAGKLKTYRAQLDNNVVIALSVAGWMLARHAADLAPVDTGLLESTLTYTVAEPRGPLHYSNIVGPQVIYGRFQELGTYKMAAQPYLIPALYDLYPQLKRTIALWSIGKGTTSL